MPEKCMKTRRISVGNPSRHSYPLWQILGENPEKNFLVGCPVRNFQRKRLIETLKTILHDKVPKNGRKLKRILREKLK